MCAADIGVVTNIGLSYVVTDPLSAAHTRFLVPISVHRWYQYRVVLHVLGELYVWAARLFISRAEGPQAPERFTAPGDVAASSRRPTPPRSGPKTAKVPF